MDLTSEKPPFVSLCVICGDEGLVVTPAGVPALARLLGSVLDRPDGPLVDEVVIGWNGRGDLAFLGAVESLVDKDAERVSAKDSPTDLTTTLKGSVRLVSFRQKWGGNFARARQETFERASGVWRGYLDTDDVVPDPDRDRGAIEDSLRAHGVRDLDAAGPRVGPSRSFTEYLRGLPPTANCLVLPYDYTIGGDGKALERHPRRRFVRWADGWAWRPGEYYHEDLAVTRGAREFPVMNGALPIRHYPVVAVAERMGRNRAVFQQMLREVAAGKRPADARVSYNAATFAIKDGDYTEAARLLGEAIGQTSHREDLYLYRHLRAKMLIQIGALDAAAVEAVSLLGMGPGARHGWDLLSEVANARAEWEACVRFHEIAKSGDVLTSVIDRPVERESHTRVIVAMALEQLGRFDDAVAVASQAIAAASEDAQAQDTIRYVTELRGTLGRRRALLNLARDMIREGDVVRAKYALEALPPGVGTDPEEVVFRRLIDERFRDSGQTDKPLETKLPPHPWVSAVGGWLLRKRYGKVLVRGRPDQKDLDALVAGVPGTEFVLGQIGDEVLDYDAPEFEAIVEVDRLHQDPYVPAYEKPFARVVPAPGVVDAGRISVPTLESMARGGFHRITDLGIAASSRPGADPPRMVGFYDLAVGPSGPGESRRHVTILCPFWAERWGPDSIREGGCGGSEEAVIYLAEELGALGVDVTCWGPHDPTGGLEIRGGVSWRDIGGLDFERLGSRVADGETSLIIHRAPYLLSYPALAAAAAKRPDRVWVWHHDHAYPEGVEWTSEIAGRCRHLLVSEWQRESLSDSVGVKLDGIVIGNGVPEKEFTELPQGLRRDPNRVFYASQPHRGLEKLLRAWPYVLEEEPNATLEVYYGWNTAEYLARSGQTAIWEVMERLSASLKGTPRVIARGRLPQARLAAEMRQSGVLAYPTKYPEVSCITALRAAAAGCALAVSDAGALRETIPNDQFQFSADATDVVVAAAVVSAIRAVRSGEYDSDAVSRLTLGGSSWEYIAAQLLKELE